MEYQHTWTTYMQEQHETHKINISNVRTVKASLFGSNSKLIGMKKMKSQEMTG